MLAIVQRIALGCSFAVRPLHPCPRPPRCAYPDFSLPATWPLPTCHLLPRSKNGQSHDTPWNLAEEWVARSEAEWNALESRLTTAPEEIRTTETRRREQKARDASVEEDAVERMHAATAGAKAEAQVEEQEEEVRGDRSVLCCVAPGGGDKKAPRTSVTHSRAHLLAS